MNELKTLEDRLKSATNRISAALSAKEKQHSQLASAQEENATLRESLRGLRQKREHDLAEVNELIEQIRPLMEGEDDA